MIRCAFCRRRAAGVFAATVLDGPRENEDSWRRGLAPMCKQCQRMLGSSALRAGRAPGRGGRAEKTIYTYTSALAILRRFCDEQGMPELTTLSTGHLREFFNSLHKRGNKPASVSVQYRAIVQFYKWLVTEGERPDNPVARTCPS
ncbi:hypothetical protein LCGC14_3156220, partial [marine sediment metagenome]